MLRDRAAGRKDRDVHLVSQSDKQEEEEEEEEEEMEKKKNRRYN